MLVPALFVLGDVDFSKSPVADTFDKVVVFFDVVLFLEGQLAKDRIWPSAGL